MDYELKDVKTALGTFVTIIVIHTDVQVGAEAIRSAFAEISRIQALMSIHNPASEISLLNFNGKYEDLSQDTKYVIQKSQYYSVLSKGAFDITILPVLELWEAKNRCNTVPSEEDINEKQQLVNYKNTVIEDHRVWFTKTGMKVTLAGVAKGYAVDKAIETLINYNIKHALVNAGGDIRCIGGKTETLPWKIAVRNPQDKRRVSKVLEVRDKAVATSGTYQRTFKDILDPRSGRPAEQDIISASILAETAMEADILTKCLYVPGIIKGKELLQGLSCVEAIIINRDGDVMMLPEIKANQISNYGKFN
jgi:thiamine biosynthesis lipoprotein